jgi:hypothetical protein
MLSNSSLGKHIKMRSCKNGRTHKIVSLRQKGKSFIDQVSEVESENSEVDNNYTKMTIAEIKRKFQKN